MDHARRLERLREGLEGPLLVTSLVNIRYLTGFTGSNAFLVVNGDGDGVFLTDGRYAEVAEPLVETLDGIRLEVYSTGLHDLLAGSVADGSLELEAGHVSWAFVRALRERFDGDLVPGSGRVEALRMVKDASELDALQRAATAGDAAFAELRFLWEDAETEHDVAEGLIGAMVAAGADRTEWPPIVAVGPHAARPHHRAGPHPLTPGLLLVDYGCEVEGYHSDMTRTVWMGEGAPDAELAAIHAAVLESNEAGIAAVAPGVRAADVDAACREVLRGHGYAEYFVHSTGHGCGLQIHEAPSVRRESEDVLAPGHVITIEPGVYLPGVGGVRIEDMVVVTETGGDVLTASNKELDAA